MPESLEADVVVIGTGFAGLSAAVRLAEAGRRVVVLEGGPRLGGRASTFADPSTGERIDNGQHVLFGCYRETYAFLRRIGTDRLAPLDKTLTLEMAGGDGRLHTLSCPPLPAPWHLVAAVLKCDAIPLRDRIRALGIVRTIRKYRRADGAPGLHPSTPLGVTLSPSKGQAGGSSVTVTQWLEAHGQSRELRRWLWTPLAFAALNQSPDVAAAGPFVRVLVELFGPRVEDAAVGLPSVPLDELYAVPAARFIERHGGRVLTKSPARLAVGVDRRFVAARPDGTAITARAVVSAIPWHAFDRLWRDGCPRELDEIRAVAAAMQASPIVTVNLWFEPAPAVRRFVGLPDGRMHWAFNKAAIFGAPVGHLSMVASGARDLAGMNNAEVAEIALEDLSRAVPGVRAARLTGSLVVREHRATFSLAPGGPARPPARTAIPGFVLAGDWTDTGLPATIEGAVRSGHRAAEEILRRPGVEGT